MQGIQAHLQDKIQDRIFKSWYSLQKSAKFHSFQGKISMKDYWETEYFANSQLDVRLAYLKEVDIETLKTFKSIEIETLNLI